MKTRPHHAVCSNRNAVYALRILLCGLIGWASFQGVTLAQEVITNGENHTGSIVLSGEIDTWTFQANTGDAISLSIGEVVDNGGFVPWIRLLAPNATQIGSGAGALVGQIDVLSAPQTGTYTVLVASADAGATGKGNYRLTLAQWPGTFVVPSGDEGGAMTNGDNHSGTIHLGDLDQWSFQANVGDAISLSIGEITDTGGFTPWIRLRAPNGAQLGSGAGALVGQIDILSAPQTGTYTVVVTSADAARTGTGTYRLTLAKSPGNFIVPSGDEGGAMTNGENHSGTIHLGDLDQWSFQANVGDAISLSIGEITDTGGFTPWIRLRAPDGTQLGSGAGALVGQIDILSAPQTGTYTVVAASGDAARAGTGTYRLTLAKSPGTFIVPSGDEGGAMTNGENYPGTIHLGDLDQWSFQANVGDAISLSIGEVTDTGGFTPWIRLRAPNGAQLGSGFGALVGQIDILSAPQTGIYTVVVASGDAARTGTGTYRLTLAKSPGSFIVPSDDEGGEMTNGENYPGTIHLGDLDQWSFQANVGDAISLSIGESTDTGGFVPWIRLRAPNGAELGSGFGALVGQIDVLSAPQTGMYTVVVTSGDAANAGTGTYRLTLAKSPGTFVVPSGDEGGAMTNGDNHFGTILLGDLDQWSFQANVGDAISLSIGELTDTGGFTPWIRLRAPNGAQVGSGFGALVGQIDVLSAPQTGTYTVVVASGDASRTGTGTYRVTLAKTSGISPGTFIVPSGDEGGGMTNGNNHTGTIQLGDLDPWSFHANVGDAISLSVGEVTDTGGFTPWIRLWAPNGDQLGSGFGSLVGQIDVLSAPQTGIYIVVTGSADASRTGTGTYRLTLAESPESFVIPSGDEGGALKVGSNNPGTIHLGDLDEWTFQATSGQTLTISINESTDTGGFTPWIRLRAPNGAQVGSSFGAATGQINIPSASQSGTYTVVVGSADAARAGTGTYAITSSHAGIEPNEPKRLRSQITSQ